MPGQLNFLSTQTGEDQTDTTDPWDQTSTTVYNDEGLVTQVTHTNTSVTLYDYDAFDRCTDVWHKTSGGATLGRYQYEYDNAGNVTERTDSDGSVTTFGYDAADQLTGETRTGSGAYTLTYSYDANGNRLTRVLNNVTENYSYDANDRLQSAGGKSYAYDQGGNCTGVTLNNQTTTLSWDFEDRLVGITYPNQSTNSFAYNGLGLRVGKTDSGGSRSYVTGGSEVASPVLGDGSAVYTPGEGERRSDATKTYHTDALGSVRGITSAAQSATDATLYDAFGVVVSRTGSTPTPFGFAGDWQYQGDADSGLMLLGHRYYDPSTGRFLSQDPIGDGDNWYAYCDNEPLGWVDPDGLSRGSLIIRLVKGIKGRRRIISSRPIGSERAIRAIGDGANIVGEGRNAKRKMKKIARRGYGKITFDPGDRHWQPADPHLDHWQPENRPARNREGHVFIGGGAAVGIVKGIVDALDPTPIGLIVDATELLKPIVDPALDDMARGAAQLRVGQWLGAMPGER